MIAHEGFSDPTLAGSRSASIMAGYLTTIR
jgi:hypothetical protein